MRFAVVILAICVSLLAPAQDRDAPKKPSRTAIKLAIDPAAKNIGKIARTTTIDALRKMARPADLAADNSTAKYQKSRVTPLETSRWKVSLTITDIVKRDDGDFYLTARDTTGHKLILESPDPEECRRSPFRNEIKEARRILQQLFQPGPKPKNVNEDAEVVALGFFGRAKDGENGARLQPILHIKFLHIR